MNFKKYRIDRHLGFAAMLLLFTSFYPPNSGVSQTKVEKPKVVPIVISPYAQAADVIQEKITDKRNDRDMDLKQIISELNRKLAQRPRVYIVSKPKIVHDTVFYAVPQAETDTDYFQKSEIQPIICTDTVYIIEKRSNLFQRIFRNKKKSK